MSVVDGLPFADDKKKFITESLDPILEEMVSDLLTEIPAVDPLDFMAQWLRKRANLTTKTTNIPLKAKNSALKQELDQLKMGVEEAGIAIQSGDKLDNESEEEEDDEVDDIPESFKKPEGQMNKARASVSAEAYGQWNQKKAFTPPNHPKSDQQKERLKKTLSKSFMFNQLDPKDMETILMAMREFTCKDGEKVIKEGADGDFLFVVEKGKLECVKKIDGKDKVVKTCEPGDVFGELALLYNCPRAATVVAKGACVCWQLDRDSFSHIVKDSAVKRREKYDSFLKSVSLLTSLGAYERSQIADALVPESFKKGDTIVRQNEPGDKFYIVEDGKLYAEKGGKKVMEYKSGDYFGELALLKNQPRAASVMVSSSEAKVLSMSRISFSKMLGPLSKLLAKKANTYR
mmetsp:Transcript_75120/g.189967  ORF Transcript_75120/g.189967 Transcript_75120/m.189967 type:complete len:403 (+) Transcript_75120:96-1304(+)